MDRKSSLLIFNIQRYSLHDGSGIRTVVFLKGCPLRCRWCCNPESQSPYRELMFRKSRCLGCEKCGLCREAAPAKCISIDEDGCVNVNFNHTGNDPEWVSICPSKALTVEGYYMSIDEILQIVERDSLFYRNGNGGLTLSGGEPLMQEAAIDLLKKTKEHHIRTAIETCGCVEQSRLLAAAEYIDEIFYDIKSVDDKKHYQYTGVSNQIIIDNLKELCNRYSNKRITVRTPVIPGFNDTKEELDEIEELLLPLKNVTWEKLPYHTYGVGKYEMLGREYQLETES